jgi:hypothetical protein
MIGIYQGILYGVTKTPSQVLVNFSTARISFAVADIDFYQFSSAFSSSTKDLLSNEHTNCKRVIWCVA